MLELTRPRWFIPVHGEWRHMVRHGYTAEAMGVPRERVVLLEDGERVRLTHAAADLLEPVPAGRTFVDGNAVHDTGQVILRDRQNLSEGGILVVVVGIDMHTGKVLLGPELLSRGFATESAPLLDQLKDVVEGAIGSLDKESLSDAEVVRVRVRNRLRRHIEKTLGRRPIVMPMIVEM
jgi:ribonuclease J